MQSRAEITARTPNTQLDPKPKRVNSDLRSTPSATDSLMKELQKLRKANEKTESGFVFTSVVGQALPPAKSPI